MSQAILNKQTMRQRGFVNFGAGLEASLTNYLLSGTKGQPQPVVRMGATILMYTDRHAVTIVEVKGKRIAVQQDRAIRTDDNGMSECQSYRFEADPQAPVTWYSLRKTGAWVRCGDSFNGQRLRIGERNEYHDYSF